MANPSKSVISGFTMKMGFVQKLGIPKTIIMSRFRFIPFFLGQPKCPTFWGPKSTPRGASSQALQDFRDGVASILVATAAIEEGTVGGTWGGWLKIG